MASILWPHLWHLYKIVEISTTAPPDSWLQIWLEALADWWDRLQNWTTLLPLLVSWYCKEYVFVSQCNKIAVNAFIALHAYIVMVLHIRLVFSVCAVFYYLLELHLYPAYNIHPVYSPTVCVQVRPTTLMRHFRSMRPFVAERTTAAPVRMIAPSRCEY